MPAAGAPVTIVGLISTVLVERQKCVTTTWDPDWQSLVDDGYMIVYDPPIPCENNDPVFSDGSSQISSFGRTLLDDPSAAAARATLAAPLDTSTAPYPRKYLSDNYYLCFGYGGTSTGTQANGVARVGAWFVTEAVTITRLFLEFTTAGEANSYARPGVWADNGFGQPGTVAIDPGLTISTGTGNAGSVATGGTPGVYEVVLPSPITLQPGLYWAGAATQNAPTTQPSFRTIATVNGMPGCPPLGTALPILNVAGAGHLLNGQTGALTNNPVPAPTSGSSVRLGFKVQ